MKDIDTVYEFFLKPDEAEEFFLNDGSLSNMEKHAIMTWIRGSWYERAKGFYNSSSGITYIFPFNSLIYRISKPVYKLAKKFSSGLSDRLLSKLDWSIGYEQSTVFTHEYLHQVLAELLGDEHPLLRENSRGLEALVEQLTYFDTETVKFTEPANQVQ